MGLSKMGRLKPELTIKTPGRRSACRIDLCMVHGDVTRILIRWTVPSGEYGAAGMRPERRLEYRNGSGEMQIALPGPNILATNPRYSRRHIQHPFRRKMRHSWDTQRKRA